MPSTETITLRLVAQDLASGNIAKAIGGIDKMAQRGGIMGNVIQGVGMQFGMMLNPMMLATRGLGMATEIAGDAIRAASDLEESQAKVGEVFTETADDIRDWADDSAKAFGLSEQAALEASGTFGNFIQALGGSEDAAADMSMSLVELGADLASFNNQSIDSVLVALRSGLAGETEPMRRLGADISAARLEADALAKGIRKVNGKLTESQKVQLRYEAILKDTSKAQGDFARTSDGLANSQRIMAAEMEDAMAKVGEALLPVATLTATMAGEIIPQFTDALDSAYDSLSPLVDALEHIPEPLRDAAWEAFIRALTPAPINVMNFADSLGLLGDSSEEAGMQLHRFSKGALRDIGLIDKRLEMRIAPAIEVEPLDFGKAFSPTEMLKGLRKSLTQANQEINAIIEDGAIKDSKGRNLVKGVQDKYARLLGKLEDIDVDTPAGNLAALYIGALGTEIEGKEEELAGVMNGLGLNVKDDFITGGTSTSEEFRKILPSDESLTVIGSAAGNQVGQAVKTAAEASHINIGVSWHLTPPPDVVNAGGSNAPYPGGWDNDPKTPWPMATGGIVRKRPGGIIAQLGEGRYDEAVVPLDGKTGVGDTYHLHMDGAIVLGTVEGARRFAEAVGPALKRAGF